MEKQNITFIGMTGSGKSTVGALLAKALSWNFVDVDIVLEAEHGKSLQSILDEHGDETFQSLETKKVKELRGVQETVISPGGSVVYSPEAMALLKSISTIVYLAIDAKTIRKRIDASARGIVGIKEKSFDELFEERKSLYEQYADITIQTHGKTPREVVEAVVQRLAIKQA